MSDEITFLPALRRGFAQALTTRDPLHGSLPRGPSVPVRIEVAGTPVERAVRIEGPDRVAGVAAAQVVRREPQADATEVEPSYFPLIELAMPDLPWAYTPAAAAAHGRLRPWLVLVVVEDGEGVSLSAPSGGTLPVLRIGPPAVPANELPDLADSWGWAHVQSLVGADVAGTVAEGSGYVIARLMCPRRLEPGRAYLACLVPAFDGGVAGGLGHAQPAGDSLRPAWDLAKVAESIELPVYTSWRFTTGPTGDFEALCRRLAPDERGAEMGLHALDVTDPGLVEAAPQTVLVDYQGALLTVGAQPRVWDAGDRERFCADLFPLLDAGATRDEPAAPPKGRAYDPATDDPVVAPPLYGCWPAGVSAVPEDGWVRLVNDHPARRAAAGLGARVVRENQEALVAAAWDAAGDLRATTTALNQGRLAAEIGRSLVRRAAELPDPDLLRLTLRQQAFLADGSTSVRARLAASAVPNGLSSPAYGRVIRNGTALAHDWARRTPGAGGRLAADHVTTTLRATGDKALASALSFVEARRVTDAQVVDTTLQDRPPPPVARVANPARRARALRSIGRDVSAVSGDTLPPDLHDVPTWPSQSSDDVSAIADTVRGALDPTGAVRASLLDRIPALAAKLGTTGLPTSVPAGPVFDDPLCWDLLALGSAWLLPGIGRLGANRVRLVETNASFVGAFLIGANQGLGCELLWRGYPVDLRATAFHRFWNYVDPDRDDIVDLDTWKAHRTIEANMESAAETMTVIVVRGDVVRRYPTAHWYLQEARLVGGQTEVVTGSVLDASFIGSIDRSTLFLGFDKAPDDVRGDRANDVPGWFVAVEEQPGAPRFGLDEAAPEDYDEDPAGWDEVSWGHLVDSAAELADLTHARTDAPRLTALGDLEGATWGRNSAHLARITWQRPFRMLIHADELI